MKRIILIVSVISIISTLLIGCEDALQDMVSMYDLSKAMCSADETLPEMLYASSSDSEPAELFQNISTVDYDKIEGFFVSYAADGKAYEIAVVCVKNISDVLEVKTSLLNHVAERVNMYSTYMPDQKAKAEDADVFTNGRYAVLIICDNKTAVKNTFMDFVK